MSRILKEGNCIIGSHHAAFSAEHQLRQSECTRTERLFVLEKHVYMSICASTFLLKLEEEWSFKHFFQK